MDDKMGLYVVLAVALVAIVSIFMFASNPVVGAAAKVKPVYQCYDHMDNDGDGYCDYSDRKAYCIDGSTVGDSGCSSKEDNSEQNCGDLACTGNEDCSTCPTDCGACEPYCGDGSCNGAETCTTCTTDCGTCPDSCADSDGFNEFVQGTVTGYQYGFPFTYTDFCANSQVVFEYVCQGTHLTGYNVTCPTNLSMTCVNGRCQ